ncbi:hypothetical protein BGZ49_005487 [Haplosporangium sp. Z 27]|nr:hypothetical protein BGZ49_005487 [Haplosporangium sp. Z 27]
MLGLFLTAFPPLFGYSSLVTMAGYVYGFRFGLFIAYTSALLGSVACFYLCRRWFKVQVRAILAKRQNMKSVVKAVEKRGFKLMVLIRLAPYPFNVMNALLSATHIPLSTFTLATAISLLKLVLHVYIGSTLSSLATLPSSPLPSDGDDDNSTPENDNSHGRNLKILVMIISMLIGIGVGAYVWIVAKREIEASEDIRIERRRKRRESIRLTRLRTSSGSTASAGLGSGLFSARLLARNGSNGGGDQDRVPGLDLSGDSNFVGGAASMNAYQDYEEGQEDQALVGGHRSPVPTSPSATRLEYGTDSEVSDYLEDDEDMSDMERGVDNNQDLRGATDMSIRNAGQNRGSRRSEDERMGWFEQNGVDVSDRGW